MIGGLRLPVEDMAGSGAKCGRRSFGILTTRFVPIANGRPVKLWTISCPTGAIMSYGPTRTTGKGFVGDATTARAHARNMSGKDAGRDRMGSERLCTNGLVGDGQAKAMGALVFGNGIPVVVCGGRHDDHAEPLPDRANDHGPGPAHLVAMEDRPGQARGKLTRADLDELFRTPRSDHPGRKAPGRPAPTRGTRAAERLELAKRRAQWRRISERLRATAPTAEPAGNGGRPRGDPGPAIGASGGRRPQPPG